ncbi:MAG TPA: hypothetical protein VGR14_16845 [Verrucomicrobiae bacterium]|jgi:hypothetical protein|nr:hypothetical protein [Verrucomicrobiae bacterium]
MKNGTNGTEKMLYEAEAHQASYDNEPPDIFDPVPISQADKRMDLKARSIQYRAKKAKEPQRPRANRFQTMSTVHDYLEKARSVLRKSGLAGTELVAEEIDDLLNSRRLAF